MNGWKNCTNSYVFSELQFYDCRKTFIDCLCKFNDENALADLIIGNIFVQFWCIAYVLPPPFNTPLNFTCLFLAFCNENLTDG